MRWVKLCILAFVISLATGCGSGLYRTDQYHDTLFEATRQALSEHYRVVSVRDFSSTVIAETPVSGEGAMQQRKRVVARVVKNLNGNWDLRVRVYDEVEMAHVPMETPKTPRQQRPNRWVPSGEDTKEAERLSHEIHRRVESLRAQSGEVSS